MTKRIYFVCRISIKTTNFLTVHLSMIASTVLRNFLLNAFLCKHRQTYITTVISLRLQGNASWIRVIYKFMSTIRLTFLVSNSYIWNHLICQNELSQKWLNFLWFFSFQILVPWTLIVYNESRQYSSQIKTSSLSSWN